MTGSKKKQRGPRKATAKHLENAALYYLQRFATSAENLRRVLTRKVDRSAHFHGTDPDEGRAQVEDTIRRFLRSGLLDDDAYARARVQSLHRRGNSARVIRGKLKQKGVDDDIIAAALDARGEDPELTAAVTLAKRRRLGPFATRKPSDETREKHLAALARAGFSYAVARRVVDGDDPV
ncbi:MAG: regulator [Rhodospirillaceae bacterium]|jgi:regulatory protein|nr:regulator [Rhodospirillaceae bacterium]|tara:strand:- start:3212 stop:3748 length:537 start_codon:yes stop_codon:yes gene_type:complete